MKRPVSFFLVEYEEEDYFGHLLAFLSLTPPFLVAIQFTIYVTLLVVSRAAGFKGLQKSAQLVGVLLLGQLLNELLNLILKNWLKGPRPSSDVFTSDYGMPSSHSQFMAFLMANLPTLIGRLKWPVFSELAFISAAISGTAIIAFGRVYLGYHSIEQVTIGLLVGYIFGSIWFYRYIK